MARTSVPDPQYVPINYPQDSMHKIVSSVVLTALASSLALAYPAHAAASKAQAASVKEAPLRGHLAFLSSDALEGRGTGQRGDEKHLFGLDERIGFMSVAIL